MIAKAGGITQNLNTHGADALCCFQSTPALERDERLTKIAQGQVGDILHANDGKNIAYESFFVALCVRCFPFIFRAVVKPCFGYVPGSWKELVRLFFPLFFPVMGPILIKQFSGVKSLFASVLGKNRRVNHQGKAFSPYR